MVSGRLAGGHAVPFRAAAARQAGLDAAQAVCRCAKKREDVLRQARGHHTKEMDRGQETFVGVEGKPAGRHGYQSLRTGRNTI